MITTMPYDQVRVSREAATRYEQTQAVHERLDAARPTRKPLGQLRHALAGALMTTARVVDVRNAG